MSAHSAGEIAAIVARALSESIDITGLWTIEHIAQWFKASKRKARDIVNTPGFPKAKPLPCGEGRGHPRWEAARVIEWWRNDWNE